MSKQENNVILFALALVVVLIFIKPLIAALIALSSLGLFTLYRFLKIKKII